MEYPSYVGLGFCSNDYLALLPFIPMDSKAKMLEHQVQGGGPAATSTVAAARLGLSAAFIGAVGDDDPGKKILADFEAEGVCTCAMIRRENRQSPIAYCWIEGPTGKRSVAWTQGNLEEVRPDELNKDVISHAKVLHLDGHQTEAAIAAVRIAKANGVLVNFDAGTIRPGVEELVRQADLLIASEEFARRFTGEDDLDKAIFKLRAFGQPQVTGITMGEQGSMALDGDTIIRCPAFKTTPVDTTGAGDVYHTGFAVRYLETRDLMECMRFGSAVSCIKCGKLGGRAGIPNRAAVDEFLKSH